MLMIECPITGSKYKLPQYGNVGDCYKLIQLHPLFHADLAELNQIKLPSNFSEQALLIHAYLWRINVDSEQYIIEWHSGIKALNERWIQQSFGRIVKFVNYCALNKNARALQHIPKLRITQTTTGEQINAWLDSCELTIKEYTTVISLDRKSQDLYESNLGRDFTTSTESRVSPFARTKSIRHYIQRSFSHFPDDKIQTIYKMVARPQNYEVKQLKEIKLLCVDLLLENNEEDCREKDNILLKIDQALYDKLTVLERLNSDVTEDRAQIQAAYSVFIGSESYQNSILDHGVQHKPTISEPELPKAEPKREDYKSDFAFRVALRRWNNSNSEVTGV